MVCNLCGKTVHLEPAIIIVELQSTIKTGDFVFCVCEVNYEVCTDSKFSNFIKLEEITVTVSKHLILVSIDFYFISLFFP